MKLSSLRQGTLALLLSTALYTGTVIANDYTVSTATFLPNGDPGLHVMDGNDTLTITSNGSISVLAGPAVIASGGSNTINAHGSLSTHNLSSYGIAVNFSSIVNNTGSISTLGNSSHGIFAVTGNKVSNSGTITTAGAGAAGITADSNNVLINTGTITTAGAGADGILANVASSVSNSGNIVVNGNNSYGVAGVGDNNKLTNTGTITTNGITSFGMGSRGGNLFKIVNSGDIMTNGGGTGIFVLNSSEVTNSGTIFAKGANGIGILAIGGNLVEHSGKVISEQTHAFQFQGFDNKLSLLAPAFIGGTIDMGTSNSVNILTGRSHSNLWTFGGTPTAVTITGPVPWAWNAGTKQFATLDPTALSAAPDMLSNMVSSLSNMSRHKSGGEWWLQGYGNFTGQAETGIYNKYAHLNGGIAAGTSVSLNDYVDLGAFVGYQASNLNVGSKWVTSQTITGNGLVGGLRGSVKMDTWFTDFALYAGRQANSSNRFVNDNLQALGEDHALADFNSWFLAPEIRVGVNLEGTGEWTLTPSASARFSSQWIDGYTETGTNANASVAARLVQVFEGDIELAAMRKIDNGSLTLKGGLSFRKSLGAATQDVVLLGQTLALPMNTNGSVAGYVGVESTYDLTQNSNLNLKALASLGSGNALSFSGAVGFNSKF